MLILPQLDKSFPAEVSVVNGPQRASKLWDFIGDGDLADFAATAGTNVTIAKADGANGVVTIAHASSANNAVGQLQLESEAVLFEANKEYWLAARFKASAIPTGKDLVFGWSVTDSDGSSAGTDVMIMRSLDTETKWDLYVTNDNGSTSDALADFATVDHAWHTYALCYKTGASGTSGWLFVYVDGAEIARLEISEAPDTEVAPILVYNQGAAAANETLTLDWIVVDNDRSAA